MAECLMYWKRRELRRGASAYGPSLYRQSLAVYHMLQALECCLGAVALAAPEFWLRQLPLVELRGVTGVVVNKGVRQ
eukprot:scaffold48070_cov34-Tisochrysis_lutea.AAC.1